MSTAFCDANVLYSALLRDLLIRLALAGLCELRWSEQVQNEWIRNLLKTHPGREAALARTHALMERALPEANCSGYETLMATLTLPDPDDRHVLAAALHCETDVLLTFNLKDFPTSALSNTSLKVEHPDHWLVEVMGQDPKLSCNVLQELLKALQRPSLQSAELAAALERLTLPATAAFVSRLTS